MTTENMVEPLNGGMMLIIGMLLLLGSGAAVLYGMASNAGLLVFGACVTGLVGIIILSGCVVLKPNQALVRVLFGKYLGTVRRTGLGWVNPLTKYGKVFVGVKNEASAIIKVNDRAGNPIEIGAVIVWTIKDTAKAEFDVDSVDKFVSVQSETAIRHLANTMAYDDNETGGKGVNLRDSENANKVLVKELKERLAIAGVDIIDARISHLAYASEIAQVMLRRQQAEAIIGARAKIVHGAVTMVEMALDELTKKKIVELDKTQRANMVSNLMVVLCSENETHQMVSVAKSQ